MIGQLLSLPRPAISSDVHVLAAANGVSRFLNPVIELAQNAFSSSALSVTVGQDAEDESYRYIAIDIDGGDLTTEELLEGQRTWSTGISRVCPSRDAVHFVLGWR